MYIKKIIIKYIILFIILILYCSPVFAQEMKLFNFFGNGIREKNEYLLATSKIENWKLFINPESQSCKYFRQPTGIWLTEKLSSPGYIKKILNQARDASPIFVLYFIPTKEKQEASDQKLKIYLNKNIQIARAIGKHKAIVIVEPDVLYLSADNPKALARNQDIIRKVVKIYRLFAPNTRIYLDAAHSNWLEPFRVRSILKMAGIDLADGFATNVSNFQHTYNEINYASKLSKMLGGKNFVIDTSRNGSGPGTCRGDAPIWSDPENVSLGIRPTTKTKKAGLDAYLWIKPPGEADGSCLPAGTFDPKLVEHSKVE